MADTAVTVTAPALTAYTGHCFAAIDIKRFRPLGEFTAAMDDMLQALHDTPRADGQERIYTAGELGVKPLA